MDRMNMDAMSTSTIEIDNPYRNVYWFARMLINGDKYGAPGRNSKLMLAITSQLRSILENTGLSETESLMVCKSTIKNLLEQQYRRANAIKDRVKLFVNDLEEKLNSLEDVKIFILTVENVMVPINSALVVIPNDDKIYTEASAKAYLDQLGQKGLATVINLWDDFGVQGCLSAERVEVVTEFGKLRSSLPSLATLDENIILTAFVQEFERRLGQKRKGRAGGSLEDVTSFIFDYFGIQAADRPEHFQADIEVDKWVRCNDKWLIGISCKRTLRERWKQVTSADRSVLSRFKIKQIWQLITYDEDLSDDKLTLLGSLDHIFYLRDDSRKLLNAQSNIGMKAYVRPMSHFVHDLEQEQTGSHS